MLTVLSIIIGTLAAALLALLPGMHAYNVLGLVVLIAHHASATGRPIPAELLLPGTVSLVTAFAVLSSIPAIFLGTPEESGFLMVQPGQKYFRRGRGFDAVAMTAVGAACALVIVLPALAVTGSRFLPLFRAVVTPHQHWIVWCVIAFMLQSEWPRGGGHGQAGVKKLWDGWRSLLVGLATFALSGLLGFLLFYRNPVPLNAAFQGLMPAFVGLFTLPWLIVNLVTTSPEPPEQRFITAPLSPRVIAKGTIAGTLGGAFAAFFPGITGGVGGMLAGHATAIRDDRAFLISQGASKSVYYTGGLLLWMVPGLRLQRGGAAALLSTVHTPGGTEFTVGLAAAALSAAGALLMLRPASRLMAWLSARLSFRGICIASLLCVTTIVWTLTGLAGLAVALVGAGIGLLPVLFGSRRMNCLGVILLPLACNLSGIGAHVAHFLWLL